MKHFFITALSLFLTTQVSMAQTKTVSLQLIETSDVHGCFFPYNFTTGQPMEGSMVRIHHYVEKQRQQMGGNVMERPYQSLYCYSLHLFTYLTFYFFKRKPHFHICEAGLLFLLILSLNFIRNDPLHNCLQSKNNSRKSMHSTLTYFSFFLFSAAKLLLFCETNKSFARKITFPLTFFRSHLLTLSLSHL